MANDHGNRWPRFGTSQRGAFSTAEFHAGPPVTYLAKRSGFANSKRVTRDALRYWPIRLLPAVGAVLGVLGLTLTRGPSQLIALSLLLAAVGLELRGWGRLARLRAKPLAVATLAGACACALVLTAVSMHGAGERGNLVAKR